ncbi:dephospho-CoA kinase [Weissella ceti]|uniref:dephospho-CoA kinase n=1 Tax=Weissella ceti TaxID=759620 RepID=UPI001BD12AD1|nr:dephospho-CoA kinase [Weissella ceti]QVK12586.1 dephospho-CoA kinase [Weissella ceti]
MYKLGLTGGIATGKSTVSDYLRQQNIPVIDADAVSHDVLNTDQRVLTDLRETFGDNIFIDGKLSRPQLGKIVFGNLKALDKLNKITHPRIFERINEIAEELALAGNTFIVYDLPLLLESPSPVTFDGIMVVTTNADHQLKRLMARNNLSPEDAQKRIDSQMPIAEKVKLADFVIDNDGSIDETYNQVQQVLEQITHA